MAAVPPDRRRRYLSIGQVTAIVPLHRSSVYRLAAAGQFPKPIEIGARSFWPEDEVEEFLEARRRARSTAEPATEEGDSPCPTPASIR